MDANAIAVFISRAVSEGWAALGIMCLVAYDLRSELAACREHNASCNRALLKVRVGLARLYSIIKTKSGEADPLPTFDDLMGERRSHEQ